MLIAALDPAQQADKRNFDKRNFNEIERLQCCALLYACLTL